MLMCGPVDGGWCFNAVVAAELANLLAIMDTMKSGKPYEKVYVSRTYPIVMQYAGIHWHVHCAATGHEFPHEMVARLDDCFRLADVFGALLLRM